MEVIKGLGRRVKGINTMNKVSGIFFIVGGLFVFLDLYLGAAQWFLVLMTALMGVSMICDGISKYFSEK